MNSPKVLSHNSFARSAKEAQRKTHSIVLGSFLFVLAGCGAYSLQSRPASASAAQITCSVRAMRGDGLNGDFFYRVSDKPQRVLILLGGSEGGKSWNDHPAHIQQLIEQGYCVLSLGYFGADGLPGHLRAIPLEYFAKAFRWLSAQKEVIPNAYAVLGVSRGAELALLIGSMYPEVKAIVAIAPSSVVFPGPPTGILDALQGEHSAWSLNGREMPFVPIPYSWTTLRGMISGNRTQMFEEALQHTPAVEAAAIPAEQAQGPILLVSFTRDQIWPSTLMASQLADRLKSHDFPFYYEHAAYDTTHSNWSIEPCWATILAFLSGHHPTDTGGSK